MPPAQLNEARLIARKICREKTCHRCLDLNLTLEDGGTDPGSCGATSAVLMWQCAWVERCINSWQLVNGPASAVVASMMRFGWQVLSGTEFGTHKGVLSFATVGHGELDAVLQDAHDRWPESARTPESWHWPWLADRLSPAPLKLALQHLRTSGEHLARGALQSVFLGTMRTQNLE